MARKKFLSDVFFVQVVNILIKAIWILVIDRVVQNTLAPQEYGRYFSLLAFSILFIIVLDLGINSMNSREVAKDKNFFHLQFRNILISKGFFSVAYLAFLFLGSLLFGFDLVDLKLLVPLGLMQIAISFNSYLRSNLGAFEKFKMDGLFAVLDRVFVIVVCGIWLVVPEWKSNLTIESFILIQLMGVLLSTVGLSIVNIRMNNGPSEKFETSFFRVLLKQTLPFALLAALMSIYTRIDAVMIKNLLGNGDADNYAMGYRLLDAANMIAVLLAGILLPMFSARMNQPNELRSLSTLSARILVLPAWVLLCIAVMYSEEIMSLLYPIKANIWAMESFAVLMSCFLPISLIYIYGTLLTAKKTLKFLNILAATCVMINVILNFTLLPDYGILGAAWATLVTQSLFALGCVFNVHRRLRSLPEISELWRWTVFIIVIFLFSFPIRQFFDNAAVHISSLIIVGVLAAWVLKLLTSDVADILTRKT